MDRPKRNLIDELLVKSNGFLLAMLGVESRRRFTEGVEQLGLSWQGQNVITALCVLAQYGAVSQKQVADFTGIDPRNLVSVIDSLERLTLIQRIPNPADRRGYQLELTAHGESIAKRTHKIRAQLESDMLAPLTNQEREVLHGLLKKLWEHTDMSLGFRSLTKEAHGDDAIHAGIK